MDLWKFLDGHKTTIAAALLFIGEVLDQVVRGIWGLQDLRLDNTIATLGWLGMAMGGVGLTHKFTKRGAAAPPDGGV